MTDELPSIIGETRNAEMTNQRGKNYNLDKKQKLRKAICRLSVVFAVCAFTFSLFYSSFKPGEKLKDQITGAMSVFYSDSTSNPKMEEVWKDESGIRPNADLEDFGVPWGFAALKTENLAGDEIVYRNLRWVDLRYFQGANCKGGDCLRFSSCPKKLPTTSTKVYFCWNKNYVNKKKIFTSLPLNYRGRNTSFDIAEGDKFAGQIFVLENVFINDRGTVFDRKHIYKHAEFCRSCPLDFGTYHSNYTIVHHYEEMASVAYWNGGNFYHALLETLPSMLILKQVLENRPGLPIAFRGLQDKFFHLHSLIGMPVQKLNFQRIEDNHLFFVRRLILPEQAHCGRPSKKLVQILRKSFFGLGGKKRNVPADWNVIIGQRFSTRVPRNWESLLERLTNALPKQRVVVDNGTLPIEEARKLFSKCRLYIAPHGASLSNIVFMPWFGEVVEMRPTGFHNNVYHYLAHICKVKYNLVHGNGTKDSELDISHDDVLQLVRRVALSFLG